LKAINYNSIDSSKILNTLTISDVTGLIAPQGTWNVTTDFPGVGYYLGVSNTPAASSYTGTLFGTAGSAALKPADCSADGGTNCVAVDDYPAADKTGAASKILSGQTLAGVAGNVTLPAVGKVLTATTFGVNGTGSTGTLTIPAAGNVLATAPAYGDAAALTTPTLPIQGTWNVTSAFPGAGYFAGVSNTPAASSYTGTLFGTAGSAALKPADCAADGGTNCVAVAAYPAALASGAASKILSGQTLAGVAGNVTLPAVGKVLTGTTYGTNGTGSTGTLTIPAAGNVLATAPAYGDQSALTTPTLPSQGTWNVTTGFPGAGYFAGVSNTPAASSYTGTLFGTAGTATLSPANCAADGATNCVAVTGFPAANATGAASKILSGQTLAGVAGNVTLPAVGKVLTATTFGVNGTGSTGTLTLPSATNVLSGSGTYGDPGAAVTPSLTNRGSWDMATTFPGVGYYSGTTNTPTAGNIKSGVTIAGVAGQYPSASFPLAGDTGTADLDPATFDAQIKSSTAFEYWTSAGARQTGAGDSDISDANIKNGVSIFGTVGTAATPVAPDPWDVRVGKNINGVQGKLKVNCRNRVRSTVFNYDGAIGSIPQSGVTSGTAIDIWDTIDDYNNNVSGLPPSVVTVWGNNTDCGGVEVTAGDDNVWKDVTTTAAGAASNCATDGARCTMQDKITGLWWSKLQTSAAWNVAWSNCQSLNHNGQTGWRLPTQKELMEAYTHGIRSAARTDTAWMTEANMHNWFWSGSSVSYDTDYAWIVYLASGTTGHYAKLNPGQVVCVR
jgi:hypothetical protein